jgi:hypothetical protein
MFGNAFALRGHPRMPYRDMALGATKVGGINV